MKSLIMKDLYNIGHNAKSMFLVLLFVGFIMVPMSQVEGYIIACGILSSMMVVTTFSFDEQADWNKFAMIMPISKKGLVAGKFVILLIFSAVGVAFGLVIGCIGSVITRRFIDINSLTNALFTALASLAAAVIYGGVSIPLVLKFGAEKGRMLLVICILGPAGIFLVLYSILMLLGAASPEQAVFILLCGSPVIAAAWNYMMYKISCNILYHKEL